MEINKYSYHFSLHLHFKSDVNVDELEKHFRVKAYKKVFSKDAKDKEKTAKIWYKSKNFSNVNTDKCIELFVEKILVNFEDLKQILLDNNGNGVFTLYFTTVKERPIISLTKKTIEMFNTLGISFDVDFKQ